MNGKLKKILEFTAGLAHMNPDGSISQHADGFMHRVHVGKQDVLININELSEYNYDVVNGIILPWDDEIADIMIGRYQSTGYGGMRNAVEDYKTHYKRQKIEKDENQHVIKIVEGVGQRGGGQVIADGRFDPTISRTYRSLGGMRYSFGIELETTAGKLTHDDIVMANTSMEGDRTIKAYEYVTNVLSGDEGVKRIRYLAAALSKRCLIGEENGLHIHIGGYPDGRIWTPSFNRMFSITAIKLGVQIEDEMMGLLYPQRRLDKYLKSIKKFEGINGDNWRELLGEYVFKGAEDIFGPWERAVTHPLDEQYNSTFKISRWNKTKHKWMNLNHCNADSHVHTIEFRLFSSTGSFEKIYNFLLLSLAIVWFVENRQRLIWEGNITLSTVIEHAYLKRGHGEIYKGLSNFILKRKQLFN